MTPPASPPKPPKRQDRPLALVNARLVDPASNRDETGGVLVENGVIVATGAQVTRASEASRMGTPRPVARLPPAQRHCWAPSSTLVVGSP